MLRTSVAQTVAFVRTRWYVVLAAGVLAVLALAAYLFLGTVPPPAPPQSTTLLASDGRVIASLHGAQDRTVPIEVSLVVQPEETAALVQPNVRTAIYRGRNWLLRQAARPYVAWKTAAS